MSEMLERVARSLRKQMFPNDNPFDDLHPQTKAEYIALARAAIEAMQQPTAEMRNAAGSVTNHFAVMDIYRAMIDAALRDSGSDPVGEDATAAEGEASQSGPSGHRPTLGGMPVYRLDEIPDPKP